jgi:hypothetical protein
MGDVKARGFERHPASRTQQETVHMKTINVPHQPVTLERLERGLVVAASLMELHWPVIAPIFEKLERELAAMRAGQDAVGRAKRLLEAHRIAGVKPVA